MKSLEESVVASMDGSDRELFPYLPYLLQDLWEIGTSPEIVIALIQKHATNSPSLRMLDLGCGEGAVSIKLAQKLKCNCFGIDAIQAFIDDAEEKAKKLAVESYCKFEAGDIREKVKNLSGFDVILLGAIGPVFGDYYTTLSTLSKCLTPNGMIIIDDAYIANDNTFIHPSILKKATLIQQINATGMRFVDEVIITEDEMKDLDDAMFENIEKRCNEMIEKEPDKRNLFLGYLESQAEENDLLETKVVCSTMVIQKKH